MSALMRETAEWVANFVVLLFATTAIAQPFVVPTGSMEDTVLIGDHLIVDKIAYAPSGHWSRRLLPYLPVRRGDIVVFRYPPNPKEHYVKRVIGLPGDRLRMVDREVFVNGRRLIEPYKVHKSGFLDPGRDSFAEITVPPDSFFALGDNRDNSADSRSWGLVPRANIVGKPLLIFWSYDAPTERLADPNIVSWDHATDIALHFFTKTRWERTFRLVRPREPQFAP